ncbi:MAG: cytochrome c oxidase assembly protein [Chloroflexota bacterium]
MIAPTTQALLTQWHWQPSVLIGLVLITTMYWYAIGPARRRYSLGPPPTRSQTTYFVLSVVLLVVALISPLDSISDTYLFSGHMIQHLLLATLWPPLVLLSIPAWLVQNLVRKPGWAIFSVFSYPAVALVLFNLDIYFWHVPLFYNLTLSNEGIHILEHVSFMLFGLCNWWPVLSPLGSQRLAYPFQVLYLFANGMFMMILGILFTFSPTVFYSAYTSAPRLWGISALTDQELGGLIMWYPGNLPYGVLLIVAFYRWFDEGGPSSSESHNIPTQSHTIGPPVQ